MYGYCKVLDRDNKWAIIDDITRKLEVKPGGKYHHYEMIHSDTEIDVYSFQEKIFMVL